MNTQPENGSMSGDPACTATKDSPATTPFRPWSVLKRNRRSLLGALALVAVVAVLYAPSLRGTFLWDDDTHVTKNIMTGENGLYRSWFSTDQTDYWPITWTVFWAEWKLWGLHPLGFHVVCVLLHALCSVLCWRLLSALAIPGAWFAALIFAVHPVNVETAAWITQTKTLLATAFGMASMLLFLSFDRCPQQRWRYGLSIFLFALSMLSKPVYATLPLIFVMTCAWLRGRVSLRDLMRTVPFFVVSLVQSITCVWFQTYRSIAYAIVRDDSMAARFAGAGRAVWFYMGKVLWPAHLCFVYPRWHIDASAIGSYMPAAMLCVVALLLWICRRSLCRGVLFALGCYVAILLPVLGFVNIYYMRYSFVADHWQYPAVIAVIAATVGASAGFLQRQSRPFRHVGSACGVAIVICLAVITFSQQRIYRDKFTLWTATSRANPGAWVARSELANILRKNKEFEQARQLFLEALRMEPYNERVHFQLAEVYVELHETDLAIEQYREAIRDDPRFVYAHSNLAIALMKKGQVNEAFEHFRKALEIQPDEPVVLFNYASALQNMGRHEEAVEEFRKCLGAIPDLSQAHLRLSVSLAALGQNAQAQSERDEALRLDPNADPDRIVEEGRFRRR